jgi:menaquinone-dependent protoporphyrinogen oxidase
MTTDEEDSARAPDTPGASPPAGAGGGSDGPHLLLLYASSEGQTERIANRIADQMRELGCRVHLTDLRDAPRSLSPADFDIAIVAGSIHLGNYRRDLLRWIRRYRDELRSRPAAFLSVSLTASQTGDHDREILAEYIDIMIRKTGWHPPAVHHVAGALRYTKYGPLKRWFMSRIARERGHPTDTSRDHEFTDWTDLAAWVAAFVRDAANDLASQTSTSLAPTPSTGPETHS